MFNTRSGNLLLAVITLVFLLGCASYQAGDGSVVPFSSIKIDPVVNESLAPQINQVMNHDLREAFIHKSGLQVDTTSPDAQLSVTLTTYNRETIATNSQDTGLARKYELTLTASCYLIDLNESKPLFSAREVTATVDIFLDAGQTQAETNAIPILSKKLSEAIANEVLQVW